MPGADTAVEGQVHRQGEPAVRQGIMYRSGRHFPGVRQKRRQSTLGRVRRRMEESLSDSHETRLHMGTHSLVAFPS